MWYSIPVSGHGYSSRSSELTLKSMKHTSTALHAKGKGGGVGGRLGQ